MILLIDSYDSFTNNLRSLITDNTGKEVVKIHNDTICPKEYEEFFTNQLPLFEYIVIGPGPGNPKNFKDVGIIRSLIKYLRSKGSVLSIPILGICLGFQCICFEFGGKITKAKNIKHGQIYNIYPLHLENELFPYKRQTSIPCVRYHSLIVEEINDEIIPLAYCFEPNEMKDENYKILMAIKHKELPFYGVQYHPESICSLKGNELICNFDKIANNYNKSFRDSLYNNDNEFSKVLIKEFKDKYAVNDNYLINELACSDLIENSLQINFKRFKFDNNSIQAKILPIDICDYFNRKYNDPSSFILLNSASAPGEWSIIGLPIEGKSQIITHSVDNPNEVIILKYKTSEYEKIKLDESQDIWKFINIQMLSNYIPKDKIKVKLDKQLYGIDIPFFGGYMGIISYEEGQHILINKLNSFCETNTPDLKLVFIERFIIYNHLTNDWFIFSINKNINNDENWVNKLYEELLIANEKDLLSLDLKSVPFSIKDLIRPHNKCNNIKFELPSKDIYNQQFNLCQNFLNSGDSYELCLTNLLKIKLPNYINPWDIYKVLIIRKNPSPFSCFMMFDDCILISSSPERFLSCKETDNKKNAELRPIKGTVKKGSDISLKDAIKILKTPKEMGENLMIVDLIRHDLNQFAKNVTVTKLMIIEEYKTVYQLVSVIQGELDNLTFHGINILHKSLPPGSMTGAPKKRSVEILQQIESLQINESSNGRRGIYSGAVGYWSITDESDWSVIIRSIFNYFNDKENDKNTNTWRIGAGGGITVLSNVYDEWNEMKIKLSSVLQAFS